MAQDQRVTFLNDRSVPRRPGIAYWMQASVRTRYNHALEYAVHLANHRNTSLQVFFALSPGYPDAALRHYWFLLQGLQDVSTNLASRGIPFTVLLGDAPQVVSAVAGQVGTVVTDRGYTRIQRQWRTTVAEQIDCPLVQVESNVVVPVHTVSEKQEWSAATLRRKIHPHLEAFLSRPPEVAYHRREAPAALKRIDQFPVVDLARLTAPEDVAELFSVNTAIGPVAEFTGGEEAAGERLSSFLTERLSGFDELRNVPDRDHTSHMSPYLHFGHISPVEIVLRAQEQVDAHLGEAVREDLDSFIEELVVRRELAMNFTEFNPRYDQFAGLPEWARNTLTEHSGDERPALYTAGQLERAETSDPYWNACQRELLQRGKMHGYMRMYWGKKILEWMQEPADAMELAIALNDRYELDGRDPNGYTGVAWCFGVHDRGWPERPIFGKVRYMNANGLKRKFKQIDEYLYRWRE
ncbi:MAG: deoxyribodipyrimidine photo-lyase [Alkalispirochaeta sp.]